MRIVKAILSEYKNGAGLRELSRKYGLSAPGIKKVIENRVYENQLYLFFILIIINIFFIISSIDSLMFFS